MFESLGQVQEMWMQEHNEEQPHDSLAGTGCDVSGPDHGQKCSFGSVSLTEKFTESPPRTNRLQALPERALSVGLQHPATDRLHYLQTQPVKRQRLQCLACASSKYSNRQTHYALFSDLISINIAIVILRSHYGK